MQLLASIGVILSLIFVGVQIQQSREIAIADIYQQRTALLISQLNPFLPPERIHEAIEKISAGQPLSASENRMMSTLMSTRIAYWENNHFQYQLGLLDEEQWKASQNNIRRLGSVPNFRETWLLERHEVRKSFADEVDKILAEEGIVTEE